MGFQMPPILAIVALVCAGVGLLFQIIGVATTGWLTSSGPGVDISSGLWKSCAGDICADIPPEDRTGEYN